ncbi:MAG: 6-carboxytetrahydropterin synthase [Planctomycetes bacterium]|nr:6-carboxytetrahydropterin synthase [Planctomycetota bacterium]MCB9909647.1 6-carboxytetrahydropterin synthase [Planctomycetota bacterium]MCB9911864.1 6-carboxytetrahydropterin synthase [Planctomycetota bacterium]HRV82249.1 6-carboxytetrahydropterin synthase [Planctomycetota bacterium]
MARPEVRITHAEEFSAAHRLHAPQLSDAENKALYGPCNTVHGHNYRVEVTVTGPVDPVTGMVMNLTELMRIMREEIWDHVDHQHLNETVPFLKGILPTAENLAIVFWQRVHAQRERLGSARLFRVRVVESRDNFVDYFGDLR